MMVENKDWAALESAIGRVAINSAKCDDRLRSILNDLAGNHDGVWLLYEGQTTEWLISTTEMMVEQLNPYFRRWPERLNNDLLAALRDLKPLRDRRNTVIHGTWELRSKIEHIYDDDEWGIRPRPWGIRDQADEWCCFRSRFRRYDPPHAYTASDVHFLADRISDVSADAMAAYAVIRKHKYPDIFDNSDWKQWLKNPSGDGGAKDPTVSH